MRFRYPVWQLILTLIIALFVQPLRADDQPMIMHHLGMTMSQSEHHYRRLFGECGPKQMWDVGMNMCMPVADPENPAWNFMAYGNVFAVGDWETGPRQNSRLAIPNMFMFDAGHTIANHQYLSLDVMATAERWTLPQTGYPELLQIGETDQNGNPFVDAQHPHSSPIMGLTLSDTIQTSTDHFLKLFFAPRGESTDGPVAFMHRVTGIVNPDAPLGHHVGQDVGHISSTVVGAAYRFGASQVEVSGFHGQEPSPDSVDLPMGTVDSGAVRISRVLCRHWEVMSSFALLQNPEAGITTQRRYSASLYSQHLFDSWTYHNSLIFGAIQNMDQAPWLSSFLDEFLFEESPNHYWGRLEYLQRTAGELEVATSDMTAAHWVGAWTLGYTRTIAQVADTHLGVGASVTEDLLPQVFKAVYGGNPWTVRAFVQLNGMRMW